MRTSKWWLAAPIVLAIPLMTGFQQRTGGPRQNAAANVTARMVAAANGFLATLNSAEKAKGMFTFSGGQKAQWSNLPSGIFQRNGLRLGDLTAPQRDAAMAVVASALSRDGYQKVTDIMNGDEVLRTSGGGATGGRQGAPARGGRGGGVQFGLAEYYIAIIGTPSINEAWMIQFGGHHLAINLTIAGRDNVMTPSLPAAQPARYTLNGKTVRPLGAENDKGFALIKI